MARVLREKAPPAGRFFSAVAWAGVALVLATGPAPGAAPGCAPDRIDLQGRVTYVYDGDTVRLASGEKVRLIGINTPETGQEDAPPQPLAVEARNALRRLVKHNARRLNLRLGAERRDRYGRLLAHAFLSDGRSVAAALLEQGLGTALTVPPNLWNLGCYQQAEQKARGSSRGIWRLARYQPVDAARLPRDTHGFRLIRGRVVRIGHSTRSVWLNLRGDVALRIDREDLRYFSELPPRALKGRAVIARGWVYTSGGQPRMRIRHPAALRLTD